MSSQSSHHPREVLLAQFSLYVHKGGLKPDSFHFLFVSTGLVTWAYQVRILVGPDICHSGCAYTVLQTVQRLEMYSAAYVTMHYKEPLK